MKQYVIVEEKCKGCSKCARQCPVTRSAERDQKPFVIDAEKVHQVRRMRKACNFGAVVEQF